MDAAGFLRPRPSSGLYVLQGWHHISARTLAARPVRAQHTQSTCRWRRMHAAGRWLPRPELLRPTDSFNHSAVGRLQRPSSPLRHVVRRIVRFLGRGNAVGGGRAQRQRAQAAAIVLQAVERVTAGGSAEARQLVPRYAWMLMALPRHPEAKSRPPRRPLRPAAAQHPAARPECRCCLAAVLLQWRTAPPAPSCSRCAAPARCEERTKGGSGCDMQQRRRGQWRRRPTRSDAGANRRWASATLCVFD